MGTKKVHRSYRVELLSLSLLQGLGELNAEQTELARRLLAEDFSRNWRRFRRHETRGSWGRGWYGELDNLIGSQNVRGGDTSPEGAYIEGFREFYEINARRILAPQKDRNLKANARKSSLL
jgi:hypothetical protein